MKKYLTLFLSTAFVAGCGCGSEEPEVYSHPTGLPEGPKGDYGTNAIETPVYTYVKNEADLLAGVVTPEEYCEMENLIFPSNYVHEEACLTSEFVVNYGGVMNNHTVLEARLAEVTAKVNDSTSTPLVFSELTVDIDYSSLVLNPDFIGDSSTENTVVLSGTKISNLMKFEQNIDIFGPSLINMFVAEYLDGFSYGVPTGNDDTFEVKREYGEREITYEMTKVNSTWIIGNKK